ncbi:uncharacterized protein LOC108107747 [Drosophila eugracilis]|uniref:uncharacterized protein LOC108107747 n=1 Tax=Drosophila eugracilis TaxID=29029 RepID=UPI0007E61C18|nr:uncharacterized protein LOC108107747 [Drosophila eugracilis]XP_017070898.1 uncharacterized protein LOC108107747 [Drosophila eugracilis]XP_017070899.1 uncharacterized protein LOC108107747 [Drosophila eugracilis]
MSKQLKINSLSLLHCLAALLCATALQAQQPQQILQQQQQQQLLMQQQQLPASVAPTTAATSPPSSNIRLLNATSDGVATTFIDNTSSSNANSNIHVVQNNEAASAASFEQQPQQPTVQYAHISPLDKEVVERLIKQWAPIVWLAPEEKFMPLGVEEFLQYVHPMDKDSSFRPGVPFREYSTKSHLVTNNEIQELLEDEKSFLYGRNPNEKPVPIYGVVTMCPSRREPVMPIVPTSPPVSTRGAYIPVSIDPLEERNDTVRRSSRLFPLFQRVKREATSVPQYNPLNEYEELVMEPTQKPQKQPDLEPEPDNGVPVNNFIANLADNVKFSGGTDSDDNLEDNSIGKAPEQDANLGKGKLPGFHVTYWMFYPYSQGKTMCTVSLGPLGRIPFPAVYGYCLGNRKDIGSHVGDWEHMSLYFNGDAEPQAMYVSAHDAGAYYSYNRLTGSFEFRRQETRKGILQRPNFPKTVTTFKNHPVLFAAKGSHGLWTAPGKHRFVKVARLYDINGFGTPWNTWKDVDISYENLRSYGRSLVPDWLTYRGKWGNPKSNCHPFRRIGLNFCEFTDGPTGIPLKEPHFQCGADYR